jgi:import inner membrane translocase subunit TIM44
MEQVKKDAEANEKLKKDWDQVQATSERLSKHGAKGEERLNETLEGLKSLSSKTSERLKEWRTKAADASENFDKATEENETLKKARSFMGSSFESTAASSRTVLGKTKNVFNGFMDTTSTVLSSFGDEKKGEKLKQWKAQREAAEAAAAAQAEAAEAAEAAKANAATDKTAAADAPPGEEPEAKATAEKAEPESALVVSQARSSSWDRFGANLSDMPFLSSVFENPLFDRLFGESEIAASLREMKEIDYSFNLEEFAEDMEYIIAPHIIRSYLEGDQDALQNHCGETAFAAVNAGIKARIQQKLTLDTAILDGPKELELKGATRMEKGPPCFIWMFNMQQINCLKDKDGEIVEGAVDDIRTVHYAMAVTRHPEPEQTGLEYPWQVSELAILGNFPCW